jgi:hypothetical protein
MNRNKRINRMLKFTLLGILIASTGRAAAQSAHSYELKLSPANVTWGPIDGHTKPVLHVASGDIVTL